MKAISYLEHLSNIIEDLATYISISGINSDVFMVFNRESGQIEDFYIEGQKVLYIDERVIKEKAFVALTRTMKTGMFKEHGMIKCQAAVLLALKAALKCTMPALAIKLQVPLRTLENWTAERNAVRPIIWSSIASSVGMDTLVLLDAISLNAYE